MRGVLAELAAAGRLLPEGAEITESFGVSHLDIEKHQREVTDFGSDRLRAERFADDLPWGAHASVQRRRTVVTPWLPIDAVLQAQESGEAPMSDPQALHAKLLEHIAESEWIPASPAAALRAVLELHQPKPCFWPCGLRHEHVICRACGPSTEPFDISKRYPCETVKVISSALGVTTDG